MGAGISSLINNPLQIIDPLIITVLIALLKMTSLNNYLHTLIGLIMHVQKNWVGEGLNVLINEIICYSPWAVDTSFKHLTAAVFPTLITLLVY